MTNIRRVMEMADSMAAEVVATGRWPSLPDWAGLAWMISPYYCESARSIVRDMGAEWALRAKRVVRSLEIASEWRRDRAIETTVRNGDLFN